MPDADLRPVLITSDGTAVGHLEGIVVDEVRAIGGSGIEEILRWAIGTGGGVALPGGGATASRWELLATVAAHDLTVARVLEPHLDALAILAEDGQVVEPQSSWGVWAAEGAGARLTARDHGSAGWALDGRKPWCSLAGSVTRALVTAWIDENERGLFAIELSDPGVSVEEATWAPAGLARVVTTTVAMTAAAGRPIGTPGWYLSRDGFWWGGMGVATVWYGGTVGLARRLAAQTRSRRPDQIALMHLGAVDTALAAARAVLGDAAARIDDGAATGQQAGLLAARVRQVVAAAAEDVNTHVAHALGPAPLSQEPEHVARVADLALYLRQHHAERDAAGLGRMLLDLEDGCAPW